MEQAQWALNLQTSQPTEGIVESIGKAIGNNAAHEIAHQLVTVYLPTGKIIGGMGLDDNSIDTYNSGMGCTGLDTPWFYTGIGTDGVGIHWGPSAVTSLTNIYGLRRPIQ
jgi:hypothetical protein